MKNILLVAVMFVISGCHKDDECWQGSSTVAPCIISLNNDTNIEQWNNDYCKRLLDISEFRKDCYFSYEERRASLRKEAAEYADKMTLLRKQEEVPITCIVEKSE